MDVGSGGAADDAAVLETTIPSGEGVRRITVKVRYEAVRALRECLTPPANAEPSWPTGLVYGSVTESVIAIDAAGVSGGTGRPIGIFRGQPGGWATLTDADRKKLKSAGIPGGLLLVVRTLSRRPWSATLFELGRPDADGACIEFPLDEYVLRQGWMLDAPAPPVARAAQARHSRLRGWEVAAVLLLLACGEVLYWRAHAAGAAKREIAETPAVERRLGLQTWRSGEDLEISWNRLSDAVRGATVGTLTIHDGPLTRVVAMRPEELRENRILFHPLAGADLELRLEVVDAHGMAQVDSVELLGSAIRNDLRVADAEPTTPPPLPLETLPRSVPRRRVEAAREVRPVAPAHVEARRIEPVREELPASRGPLAVRRAKPEITAKVRQEMRQAKGRVTVSVQVSITAAGKVDGVVVLSSTGEPSPSGPYIRLASLDAARQWQFEPAIRGGSRVPSKTTVVFDF